MSLLTIFQKHTVQLFFLNGFLPPSNEPLAALCVIFLKQEATKFTLLCLLSVFLPSLFIRHKACAYKAV